MARPLRMMAAQLESVDKSRPFLLREWGQGDDAWQLVRAGSVFAAHRPEKLPSKTPNEPDKTIWIDTVTVDLEDGTQRLFNHDDQVEVRAP